MGCCVGVESRVCLDWRAGSDCAPRRWDILVERRLLVTIASSKAFGVRSFVMNIILEKVHFQACTSGVMFPVPSYS